jgi:hypothetical protein
MNIIIGSLLVLAGLAVILVPNLKVGKTMTATANKGWADVVDNLINKFPARVLLGLVLIVLGILTIQPSLAPWH